MEGVAPLATVACDWVNEELSTTLALVMAQTVPLIFARILALPADTPVTVSVGEPPLTVAMPGFADSNVTCPCAEAGVMVTAIVPESPVQIDREFGLNVIWTGVPLQTPFIHLSSTVQSFLSSQAEPFLEGSGTQLLPSHFWHSKQVPAPPTEFGLPPQCHPPRITPDPGSEQICVPSVLTVPVPMLTN